MVYLQKQRRRLWILRSVRVKRVTNGGALVQGLFYRRGDIGGGIWREREGAKRIQNCFEDSANRMPYQLYDQGAVSSFEESIQLRLRSRKLFHQLI
ncbi:unnamed protein product [Prunus armeniaca]|uniref:Uncharacterized protein n=1 Tax=Prunus armeniaca TaxID=36596 RepID=A0A6J5TMH4_PRUAR|nr:unnamed protein product [Prunus armeniaca]CAB4295695.1 unnamed protein product [Prunus armeniaca]